VGPLPARRQLPESQLVEDLARLALLEVITDVGLI
jgi:hypothetical protein